MESKLKILEFSQTKNIPSNFILKNENNELFSLTEQFTQPIIFTYKKLNGEQVTKKDIIDTLYWIFRNEELTIEELNETFKQYLSSHDNIILTREDIDDAANRSEKYIRMFIRETRTIELLKGLKAITDIKLSFRYRDFNMTKFVLNIYFEKLYEGMGKDIFNYIRTDKNIPVIILNNDISFYKFYKSPEVYKRIEKELRNPNTTLFTKDTLQGIIHMGDISNYKVNNDAFIIYKKNYDYLTIRSNSDLNAEDVKNLFINNFFYKNIRSIEGEGFNGTMDLLIDHITEKHIFYDILLRLKPLKTAIYVEESKGIIDLMETERNKAIVFHFEMEDEKIQISVSNQTAEATEKTSNDIILGKGQRYVQVNISKAKQFTTINFIKNVVLGIIQIYINELNYFSKDYSLVQLKILPNQPKISVRIQKLRKADNKLFPPGYGSICQGDNQPDFVETEEEAINLIEKGIKVIKFPGINVNNIFIKPYNIENKPKYYYCPVENREITLKFKKLEGSNYNYYICCHKDPIVKIIVNKNWDIILEYKARKSTSVYPTSTKILDVGRRGVVSQKILNILGREKAFSRYNPIEINDEFSSVFHLLVSISNNQILRNKYKNTNNKKNFINMLRRRLGEIINLSALRQEFYNYTDNEIKNYISNSNIIFDTFIGIRVLEIFFNCQIIVFIKKKAEIDLEIPRHKYFYARRLNNKPLAILIKHYENIKGKKQAIKFQYEVVTYSINNLLNIKMINDEQTIENINLFINKWVKVDKVYYNVEQQVIDPQGKARRIKLFNNNSWIHIKPSQPYDTQEHYQTEQIDTLNNNIMNKVSTIIIELMKILYILEMKQNNKIDLRQFFKKYFTIINNHVYKGPFLSRYIPDKENPKDLLKYFHDQKLGYNSIIKLKNNNYKLIINDKDSVGSLYDIIANFASFYEIEMLKENAIIKKIGNTEERLYLKHVKRIFIPRTFSNFLINVSDFIKWTKNTFIVDSLNMFKYISNSKDIFTTTQIKLEHSSISSPFIYKSNNDNYLIQNIFISEDILKKMEIIIMDNDVSISIEDIFDIVINNRNNLENLKILLQMKKLTNNVINNIIKNINKIIDSNQLKNIMNKIFIKESPFARACKIAYIWQKEKRNIGYNVEINKNEDDSIYNQNTNTSNNTFDYIEGKCNIIKFKREEFRVKQIIQGGKKSKKKYNVIITLGYAAILKLDNNMLF